MNAAPVQEIAEKTVELIRMPPPLGIPELVSRAQRAERLADRRHMSKGSKRRAAAADLKAAGLRRDAINSVGRYQQVQALVREENEKRMAAAQAAAETEAAPSAEGGEA